MNTIVANESINIHIMENEKNLQDWKLSTLARELYWWVDFFNIAFFKAEPAPMPAISFEKTKVNNLGHYVIGRNAFGIKENINLNRAHLNRPLWDLLATLLHEMTHSWQYRYGNPSKSWFHNKEFQMKFLEFGIVVDKKGCHHRLGDPFTFLLKKHGVEFHQKKDSDGFMIVMPKREFKGKSKLRKWQCSCGQTARVGKREFFATCDLCGEEFTLSS